MRCDAWQYNSAEPVARVFHMRLDFAGVVPLLLMAWARRDLKETAVFAKQGAVAIGVDFSAEQLAFARRLCERNGVRVELREVGERDRRERDVGARHVSVGRAWWRLLGESSRFPETPSAGPLRGHVASRRP